MIDRAQTALHFISPVDRDVWVSMGMALQSEYGDAAREVWMEWSMGADSFKASDARVVWRSFKGTGVTLASLFHEAKLNGWRDTGGYQRPTPEQQQALRAVAEQRKTAEGIERHRLALIAVEKAQWILDQCVQEQHAYLHSKGFPELAGLVWRPRQEDNILVIPMYVGHKLTGAQLISKAGNKKFLSNMTASKAEYVFDNHSLNAVDYWCEGFATGLSLRECLAALKVPYRIHVCFSAQNLQRLAHSGLVIADNDPSKTGQEVAVATGLPYWMPESVGEDLNDVWKREGTFKTSQRLRKWLQSLREPAMA